MYIVLFLDKNPCKICSTTWESVDMNTWSLIFMKVEKEGTKDICHLRY